MGSHYEALDMNIYEQYSYLLSVNESLTMSIYIYTNESIKFMDFLMDLNRLSYSILWEWHGQAIYGDEAVELRDQRVLVSLQPRVGQGRHRT